MKTTAELFCGTKSFSQVAKSKGFSTFTIDNDAQHNPDWNVSVLDIFEGDLRAFEVDYLWASPPCTGFSVAAISHHWGGGFRKYEPISETARIGLKLLEKTIRIIAVAKPTKWYVENPRGVMRKVIDEIFLKYGFVDGMDYVRRTITYCQYGDKRMKPTDIWTNDLEWVPKPMCKNGSPCHEAAPRGSKTGTQGLKNHVLRGAIPLSLFEEIFACGGVK